MWTKIDGVWPQFSPWMLVALMGLVGTMFGVVRQLTHNISWKEIYLYLASFIIGMLGIILSLQPLSNAKGALREKILLPVEGYLIFELAEIRPVIDVEARLQVVSTRGQTFYVRGPSSVESDAALQGLVSLPRGTLLGIPWEQASQVPLPALPVRVLIDRGDGGTLSLRIK
ncbi:MAG: hypothetical protein K1X79_10745 [Oligoflexia bacterium]|nr:hypothetical protein [Oligoflexia bacterium]